MEFLGKFLLRSSKIFKWGLSNTVSRSWIWSKPSSNNQNTKWSPNSDLLIAHARFNQLEQYHLRKASYKNRNIFSIILCKTYNRIAIWKSDMINILFWFGVLFLRFMWPRMAGIIVKPALVSYVVVMNWKRGETRKENYFWSVCSFWFSQWKIEVYKVHFTAKYYSIIHSKLKIRPIPLIFLSKFTHFYANLVCSVNNVLFCF